MGFGDPLDLRYFYQRLISHPLVGVSIIDGIADPVGCGSVLS